MAIESYELSSQAAQSADLSLLEPLEKPKQKELKASEVNFSTKGTYIFQGEASFDNGGRISYELEGFKEDIDDGTPVMLIIPGFGGTAESYRELGTEFAKAGQPTARANHHDLFFHFDRLAIQARRPQRLHVVSNLAVAEDISEQLDGRKMRLLAHSAGGPVAARMVLRNPELFESVLLVGSAGVTNHNLLSLGVRSARFLMQDLLASAHRLNLPITPRLIGQQVLFFLNPRSIPYGIATARSDIRKDLEMIEQAGVKTALVQFARDGFFDAKKARQVAGSLVHHVLDYPDERANHAWTHMMQGQVASHLTSLFDHLMSLESA